MPRQPSRFLAPFIVRALIGPALIGVWAVFIGGGVWWLWGYAATPGVATDPPAAWPAESAIARRRELPTLLVFAHPHCPCTRATVNELALLMARCQGRLQALVVFSEPLAMPAGWAHADLWQAAEEIPGVEAMVDRGDVEARRFRAVTSGHAMLYDAGGQRLYSGGLTDSRGHEGDSAGCDAIENLLNGVPAENLQTPVFGCPLPPD